MLVGCHAQGSRLLAGCNTGHHALKHRLPHDEATATSTQETLSRTPGAGVTWSLNMHSASGCSQFEKMAKDADGARRGIMRCSSTEGSMFGEARMQLLKPEEQACMHSRITQPFTSAVLCPHISVWPTDLPASSLYSVQCGNREASNSQEPRIGCSADALESQRCSCSLKCTGTVPDSSHLHELRPKLIACL